MEDKFQQLENKGRELFQQLITTQNLFIWDCDYSIDKYDRVDVCYFSGATITTGEIKTREYSSTRFKSWLIEKSKFDELHQRLSGDVVQAAVYINIFSDNTTLIWNLNDITPIWKQELHWENHKKERKVLKWVAYLPTSGASHSFKLE